MEPGYEAVGDGDQETSLSEHETLPRNWKYCSVASRNASRSVPVSTGPPDWYRKPTVLVCLLPDGVANEM